MVDINLEEYFGQEPAMIGDKNNRIINSKKINPK